MLIWCTWWVLPSLAVVVQVHIERITRSIWSWQTDIFMQSYTSAFELTCRCLAQFSNLTWCSDACGGTCTLRHSCKWSMSKMRQRATVVIHQLDTMIPQQFLLCHSITLRYWVWPSHQAPSQWHIAWPNTRLKTFLQAKVSEQCIITSKSPYGILPTIQQTMHTTEHFRGSCFGHETQWSYTCPLTQHPFTWWRICSCCCKDFHVRNAFFQYISSDIKVYGIMRYVAIDSGVISRTFTPAACQLTIDATTPCCKLMEQPSKQAA